MANQTSEAFTIMNGGVDDIPAMNITTEEIQAAVVPYGGTESAADIPNRNVWVPTGLIAEIPG